MSDSSFFRPLYSWSPILLGGLLIGVASGHALIDDDFLTTDLLEVLLPIAVGLGLIGGGIWCKRVLAAPTVGRLSKWILGGVLVGSAINLWFYFIISLEFTPTGEPVVLQLNGMAIMMGVGAVLGYYYTDLERRERALEVSEARFRALTENTPFVVITIDDTSTIRYANDGVEEVFGYTPAELVGESLTALMPEQLRDAHRAGLSRYLSDGTRNLDWDGIELTALHADGHEFPIEISFGEYHIDDDRIFTGVIRDITARKETEVELETHTSRVTQLHDVATTLASADTESEIYERAADHAVALFDCDVARISTVDGNELVPTASSGDEPLDEYEPEPMPVGYGVMTYRAGDTLRIPDLTFTRSASTTTGTSSPSPAPDTPGQSENSPSDTPDEPYRALLSVPLDDYGVLQLFSTETDVFDERDEELAGLLATHLTTSLERVSAETAIRHERDRLEEFASVLSHDLRNPLNVAQGRLELAQETDDPEHFEAIDRSLHRIERLIDDMLTLARQGEAVGDTEQIALEPVAQQAWKNVTTNDATLDVATADRIEADRSRVLQLFENLYRNTIEHGGADVTVTVGDLENGFYIEDTGPGIPPDDREHIFERGYTTSDEGTGFGLTIIKQIVDAHGWVIDIAEGSDGGARFEITAPGSL